MSVTNAGELHKEELKVWIKRVSRKMKQPIRYFGCGEYGEKDLRPHFHVILFGVDPSQTRVQKCLIESWKSGNKSKGFCFLGSVTVQSMRYVASYVRKKNLSVFDPRLAGMTNPEFRVMSLKPPIGALQIPQIVKAQKVHYEKNGWVSHVARVPQMGMVPFGRTIQDKIYRELGIDSIAKDARMRRLIVEAQQAIEAKGVDAYEKERLAKVQQQCGRKLSPRRTSL